MRCPYRMNETHSCQDGETHIYKDFAECYGRFCFYFGFNENGGWCRKIEKEVGFCDYQEVH